MKYTKEEDDRMFQEMSKHRKKCKHCGHSSVIPVYVDKKVCSWCGNYVFRTDEIEFKFRLEEKLKKGKRLDKNDNIKTVKNS